MANRPTYTLGPDIPDDEVLVDSKGRVIDDAYVDRAVEDARQHVRRGRPSLSESGESPLLRVRVSRELENAVRDAASAAGLSVPEWVRKTLGKAAHKAS
jgi:hypothetical protein